MDVCLVSPLVRVGVGSHTCVSSANNQHNLSEDIDADPKKTGVSSNRYFGLVGWVCSNLWQFFRAMAMAQCLFVLLLPDGNSMPMTRVWW